LLLTTPEDHVKSFTFKGGGGSWAKLFDGTEKVLSWDNILWLNGARRFPLIESCARAVCG
jgi:hypothetical protein